MKPENTMITNGTCHLVNWEDEMNKQGLITIIRTEVLLAKSSPERKGYIAGLEEAINIIDGFSDEPEQPVIRAWLDGYEVEKEKRYTVKLKNTNDYLNQTEVGFHFYDNCRNNGKFTRKEIEDAGFGEVFNCPLFEVKEVE